MVETAKTSKVQGRIVAVSSLGHMIPGAKEVSKRGHTAGLGEGAGRCKAHPHRAGCRTQPRGATAQLAW
eukprot:365744-Chlamydomonas_euryale.AAC.9